MAVDASEKEKIPEIIESKICRIAKNEWTDMSPSEVDDLVAESLGSLPTEFKVQNTNPMIHYNESIDWNQLNLLMMKIAYEIAFHHHGSKVSSDYYYQQLRDAIHTRDVNSRIAGRLLPQPDQFLFIPAPENSHCILLCRNICYIRLFYLSAIIPVVEENSLHSLSEKDWVIYWFNFVNKSFEKHNFLEYASGAIQQ